MSTVSRVAFHLCVFLSLSGGIFVSRAFGVAAPSCPFNRVGVHVQGFFKGSFKEITEALCEPSTEYIEKKAAFVAPSSADAIRLAVEKMKYSQSDASPPFTFKVRASSAILELKE